MSKVAAFQRPKAKAEAKAAVQQFNYDLERMKKAVASPVTVIPRGLSKEDKMRFLMGEKE